MESTIHIRTSKKIYYGSVILGVLFILYETYRNDQSLSATASGTPGIISLSIIVFAVGKILFGKGKIIFRTAEFKIQGYNWTGWEELSAVFPFVEQDTENGEKHFIQFRLRDGTDLSVRSEYLEMTVEQIQELVSRYKTSFANIQQHHKT